MFGLNRPGCGSEGKNGSKGSSHCGIPSSNKKRFFGRKSIWILCIFNILMLAWVIDITNYLSDPKLDADIVGADRFGLALIIAVWITCDVIVGLVALIYMFVRRNR
jgi:hypothetical protein